MRNRHRVQASPCAQQICGAIRFSAKTRESPSKPPAMTHEPSRNVCPLCQGQYERRQPASTAPMIRHHIQESGNPLRQNGIFPAQRPEENAAQSAITAASGHSHPGQVVAQHVAQIIQRLLLAWRREPEKVAAFRAKTSRLFASMKNTRKGKTYIKISA